MMSEKTTPPAYRPFMSAQEARSLGLDVPDDVPDCAYLKPSMDEVKVNVDPSDPTKVAVTLPMAWSWVAFTLSLTEEEYAKLNLRDPDLA